MGLAQAGPLFFCVHVHEMRLWATLARFDGFSQLMWATIGKQEKTSSERLRTRQGKFEKEKNYHHTIVLGL